MDNFRWFILEQHQKLVQNSLKEKLNAGKLRRDLEPSETYLMGFIAAPVGEFISIKAVLCIGKKYENGHVNTYSEQVSEDYLAKVKLMEHDLGFDATRRLLLTLDHHGSISNSFWLSSRNTKKRWDLNTRAKANGYFIDVSSVILL
jgi:hypothetical protein